MRYVIELIYAILLNFCPNFLMIRDLYIYIVYALDIRPNVVITDEVFIELHHNWKDALGGIFDIKIF